MNRVILWGGVGIKNSNHNRQYQQQNRIYDSEGIAVCIGTSFMPWYKVEENESRKEMQTTRLSRG